MIGFGSNVQNVIFFQSKIVRRIVMASAVVLVVFALIVALFVAQSELKSLEPNSKDKKSPSSPHIVFILADDMGWNDVSYHGSDQIPTPNIDALAYNGVILNNHYVQPICTPTRAALLTGKYPIHMGMQGQPILATEKRGLPLEEKTMAQYLKKLGYSTHIIGKWHLGYYTSDFTPLHRGFDSHIGYWNGAISYYDHLMQELGINKAFSGHDFRKNYTTAWEYQGKYATDIFTDEAVNTIKNHDEEIPLFLYLSHLAVHAGNEGKWLEAPQETIDKFRYIPNPNRRTYAAMVAKLDESVGKVISALQEKDMLRDSIIVFLSDNGAPINAYFKNWGSNQPFRGEKGTLWEGGIRTAALVWSPLIEKPSRVSKQLMHVSDWLPTLFTAAGGKDEELSKDLDGLNMWPTIVKNEPSLRKQLVLNIDEINKYGALVVRKDNEEDGKKGTYKIVIGKNHHNLANDFNYLDETSLTKPYNIEDILSSPVNLAITSVVDRHINTTHVKFLRQEATITCTPVNKVSECTEKCLFDLDNDPCEQIDLADSNSLMMSYMEDLYNSNLKTVVSQAPEEFDPAANPAFFNYTWSSWIESREFQLNHEYHVMGNK